MREEEGTILENCGKKGRKARETRRKWSQEQSTVRVIVEKMLAKDKNVYAAFMDFEKAYEKVDWETLWDVLRIYRVGEATEEREQ